MLKQMTAREYREAMIFALLEPLEQEREELRHGQQMAQLANIYRDSKQKREPYSPRDFMNFIDEPETIIEEKHIETEKWVAQVDSRIFKL